MLNSEYDERRKYAWTPADPPDQPEPYEPTEAEIIADLREQLAEANARIAELEAAPIAAIDALIFGENDDVFSDECIANTNAVAVWLEHAKLAASVSEPPSEDAIAYGMMRSEELTRSGRA